MEKGIHIFFSFYRDYSDSLTLSNASELFWSWISINHIEVHGDNECCHCLFTSFTKHDWLGIFTGSRAVDATEMYKNSLLLRRFVFRIAEASAKRVTGDEPQGTMGRVQTAGEARCLLPAFLCAHVLKRDVWVRGRYKKMWCTCSFFFLACQAIAYLTFSLPPHLKLPIIYDILWWVTTEYSRGKFNCSCW